MGALDASAPASIWAIADATGIRPEYQLPVYYAESGFDPSTPNRAGFPYYGINQVSGTYLATLGIDPSTYLTWSASEQLEQVVLPFTKANVAAFGVPASGTRAYQLNFLPATVRSARSLTSVLAWRGSQVYTANAGLDSLHVGAISVYDLAAFVARAAASSAVQSAIAACYALRPDETPEDPVYGTDFFDPVLSALAAGILGLVTSLAKELRR